jgi:GAF domain-containing protein
MNMYRRQVSFCAHAIQSREEDIFVIPETLEDARFVNNGLVTGPPYIRFYAGECVVKDCWSCRFG